MLAVIWLNIINNSIINDILMLILNEIIYIINIMEYIITSTNIMLLNIQHILNYIYF